MPTIFPFIDSLPRAFISQYGMIGDEQFFFFNPSIVIDFSVHFLSLYNMKNCKVNLLPIYVRQKI